MKKHLFNTISVIFLFFCLIVPGIAYAENIAVVDLEKVIENSVAMKNIQQELLNKQAEFQNEIDERESKLREKQISLEKQSNAFTEDVMAVKQSQFNAQIIEFQNDVKYKQLALKKASVDGIMKLDVEIRKIIGEVAEKEELDLVVPSSQVLYIKDSVDISDDVLVLLNKRVKKIDLHFEL